MTANVEMQWKNGAFFMVLFVRESLDEWSKAVHTVFCRVAYTPVKRERFREWIDRDARPIGRSHALVDEIANGRKEGQPNRCRSTACKAIHVCRSCHQPFDEFKAF